MEGSCATALVAVGFKNIHIYSEATASGNWNWTMYLDLTAIFSALFLQFQRKILKGRNSSWL